MSLRGDIPADSVLPVLYDLTQTIGSELTVKMLLSRTLQRFLYHTSFPVGFICVPTTQSDKDEGSDILDVAISAAIGDFRMAKTVGTTQTISKNLFINSDIQERVGHLLDTLPVKQGQHTCFLRLRIPGYGFFFLLGPILPENNLPMAYMFDPVLAHFSRAIILCAANDAQKSSLIRERDELVNKKRMAETQVDFLAHYDPLTKLPNLATFQETVEKKIASTIDTANLFVLAINIDDFNKFNISLGRPFGDSLLIKIADRLHDCLRESDVVTRGDADNFLVLFSEMRDKEAVASIAMKILGALSKPFSLENDTISITCTIGISVFPEDGRDFNTLFKHANTAMKYAKAGERGQFVFFASAMDEVMHERFTMENHLHMAIEHDELELYYQPFIDMKTRRVVGVEALLRWQNPTLGRVSPSDFIPVAEQCGLIVPIGEWVINEACRQYCAWQADGVPIGKIAINISAVQFKKCDLPKIMKKYLHAYNIKPNAVELELTESIMINNTEHSLDVVARLKDIGLDLSLDDFGTGYSSFSYLSRFPIDKLKIDQSFVRDLGISKGATKIVKAIIDLGISLGLSTVAEGIETQEQNEFLEKNGCDLAQGYLHSHPLPRAELARKIGPDGSLVLVTPVCSN